MSLPRKLSPVVVLLMMVCAGCAPAVPAPPPSPTPSPAPAAAEPTQAPTPAATSAPVLDPQAFVGGAGLTLSSAEGLWEVTPAGGLTQIVDQSQARLSPDGSQVAYLQADPTTGVDDVWLLDLSSGARTNLTQTPDRYETVPMWWPGRLDVLVFGSDTASGMENGEYPTVVHVDGTGYQVLDAALGGPRAVSPDGMSIAYAAYGVPGAIYTWGTGVHPFSPSDFGVKVDRLLQPAFSPDGRQLAWMAAGTENNSPFQGLAVFDLENKTGALFHQFQPAGGSPLYDVAWSPDGQWIAFVTFGEPPAAGRAGNVWVIHPDGSQETYVGEGLNPVWSPDGSQLAYIRTGDSGTQEIWLAPSASWEPHQLDLPDPAQRALFLMGWSIP
jgi:WD40-like Beta Propeller Repeat